MTHDSVEAEHCLSRMSAPSLLGPMNKLSSVAKGTCRRNEGFCGGGGAGSSYGPNVIPLSEGGRRRVRLELQSFIGFEGGGREPELRNAGGF